jgi:hypothetical protein
VATWTQPGHITFLAQAQEVDEVGHDTNSIDVGSAIPLIEVIDSANAFAAGTYTIPTTGRYRLTVGAGTKSVGGTSTNCGIEVRLGGSPLTQAGSNGIGETGRTVTTVKIYDFTVGDALTFVSWCSAGTGTSTVLNAFSTTTPNLMPSYVMLESVELIGAAGEYEPVACNVVTDAELQALGYESVTLAAHGAIPNDAIDDTAEIQSAIEAAMTARRSVYFPPGEYIISDTLELRQPYQANETDYPGGVLIGSSCGSQRPTIRMQDGVDNARTAAQIANEPTPMILALRDLDGVSATPDTTDGSRSYDHRVQNLRLVTGANSGVAAIRFNTAEGSGVFDTEIVATGGFAGIYEMAASGGYYQNIEVVGGAYAIFAPKARGGASLIIGLTASGQTEYPIAYRNNTPVVLLGANIVHDTGPIIVQAGAAGSEGTISTTHTVNDGSNHFLWIDSQFELTAATSPFFVSEDRTLVIRNSYFKGNANIVQSTVPTPDRYLTASTASAWIKVTEFVPWTQGSTLHSEEAKSFLGAATDNPIFNGASADQDYEATSQEAPPQNLASQHMAIPVCEPKATNVQWTAADPTDSNDDLATLTSELASTAAANKILMLKGHSLTQGYLVSDTLVIPDGATLCAPAKFAVFIKGIGTPASTRPVVATIDSATAHVRFGGFFVYTSTPTGSYPSWGARWNAFRISAGNTVAWNLERTQVNPSWNNPGPEIYYQVTANGGGKVYQAMTGTGWGVPSPFDIESGGTPITDPLWAGWEIDGSTEGLDIYSAHIQHPIPAFGSMARIEDSANVRFFGGKSELATTPDKAVSIINANPGSAIPSWMNIVNSTNIHILGAEGLAQQAQGRGLIEATNSPGLVVAVFGGRTLTTLAYPVDEWNRVDDGTSTISAAGFMAYFRN